MKEVLVPTACAGLFMNGMRSALSVVAFSSCARNKTKIRKNATNIFNNCAEVQPWIINLAVAIYLIHVFCAIFSYCGLRRVKGYLIMPWIVVELVILTYKVINAQYYAFFYPIWTVMTEFDIDEYSFVYMEIYLELAAELLSWILVCVAYDSMYETTRKRRRRIKIKAHTTTTARHAPPKQSAY